VCVCVREREREREREGDGKKRNDCRYASGALIEMGDVQYSTVQYVQQVLDSVYPTELALDCHGGD
jgi:hypothetical protein